MFRWLIVTFLALLLIGWLAPALRRWGFGKLPGDFSFTFRGRLVPIPLGSTLVLSLVATLISKLF
jgi:Protein of unknown function (DUF2905)